jgi:cyclohexanecarboxylate-CoA ligase
VTRLSPTFVSPRAAEYRAPGGPWTGPPLDTVLSVASRGAEDPTHALDGAALADVIDRCAGGLHEAGVHADDIVVWQQPNGIQALALTRACWRLGAVAAPVHHLAGPATVEFVRATLQPNLDLIGYEALPQGAPIPDGADVAPDAVAAVLFTSGSTGNPKAVLHTNQALAYKAALMVQVHELTADDVVLMPAPLAHVSGLLNGILVPGAAGMKAVLMPRWSPELALDLIEEHGVTFMIGPPTFYVSLMDAPGFSPARVESLRLISSGGAGVTPAFIERATSTLGALVKRSYGSTEAPTVATSMDSDPFDRARDTDGRAIGAAEFRLDPETGELQVIGPELFAGYLDETQNEAAITPDGWYRTGDLATLDADGWLTIVGRLQDIIIRGGENIAAAAVEAALEAHPGVRAAVVVGFPDDLMGERVAAYIVADDTFDLDECREWFGTRGLARFMTPERVVHVEEFPLLPTGKADRAEIRRLAAE